MSPTASSPGARPAGARPVGVLALQGDFAKHGAALASAGCAVREVRAAPDLDGLAGLVLPGGESTTILRLLERESFEEPLVTFLRARLARGWPVLATCAGVVLLARKVRAPDQRSLGLLDVDVVRNAYGRQVASGVFGLRGERDFPDVPGTFIRAPRVVRTGPEVDVLARRGEDPVLMRQGSLLAATFHPELDVGHPATQLFVAAVRASESIAAR